MKFAIPTAALLLLFGTTASAYARQDKAQDDHKQEAKPPAKQAKPPQAKPAEKPAKAVKTDAKPAARPVKSAKTEAKPTQQERAQTQAKPAAQQRVAQTSSTHGRISNAHYASSFGSGHTFHVSEGDYRNHRFQYGGYSFGFLDPWPVGWGYSDNVYVVYVDGGYYMYDPVYPGVRISINIL
jgi:hypothetical protein